MGKKAKSAEQKKECPSCGLGVSLESAICEFCGWDFQEENEWILQIEKLERELMLEKQKFEPGTVGHMIESTLRNPHTDRPEASPGETAESAERGEAAGRVPVEDEREMPQFDPEPREEPVVSPRREEERAVVPSAEVVRPDQPREAPKVRKVRSVKAPPPSAPAPAPAQGVSPVKVRRVVAQPGGEKPTPPMRKVRQPPQEEPVKTRKVRSIRKV